MEKLSTDQAYFHKENNMKYFWATYLEFLLFIGQFNSSKNWIDNHILICYNKLNQLKCIPNNLDKNNK